MEVIDDCNNAVLSGWYATDYPTANTPGENGEAGVLCTSRRFDKRIYQEFHQINGNTYCRWSAVRISYGDVSTGLQWGPWEYINPFMMLGVEYRTTERYLGKPVYVKTINMGNLPGNAVKRASFQSNNVVDKIVSVTGQCTTDSGVNISMPYHAGSGPNWNTVILIGADGSGAAQIVTFNEEFAGYTDARITVKYTKLVD